MLKFHDFRNIVNKRAALFLKQDNLFVVDVDKDELWETYLNSFQFGNGIFRERTSHDCSACRTFIKQFGGVVAINNDYETISLWNIIVSEPYYTVVRNLDDLIVSGSIVSPFATKNHRIGVCENRELRDGQVFLWQHFYADIPDKFIHSDSEYVNNRTTNKEVLKSSLELISIEATETVLELIASNSLYRGEEWQGQLKSFLELQQEYSNLSDRKKDNFCWVNSGNPVLSRIKNHSIGTLLLDISEGVELDEAVRKYGHLVDPVNYKHPKTIFSKTQVKQAEEFAKENGFFDSLQRRFANLDDISVNDIIFRGEHTRLKDASPFSELSPVSSKKPDFDYVQEIGIDEFVDDVLPLARGIEVYIEGRHNKNLVSLTAPVNDKSKTMFKWDNGYAWVYNGNLADSSIKQNVAKFGGDTTGVLRFSIQWNDHNDNHDDLDAHCIEPDRTHIYYGSKINRFTGGNLDVDIIDPPVDAKHNNGVAVENITWPRLDKMSIGQYQFFVRCYTSRNASSGFKAEIEFNGQIYQFEYSYPLRHKQDVPVAKVVLKSNGEFEIKEDLPFSLSSREIWGLSTNEFHPVDLVMLSPNYWQEGNGTGNKHYFFIINDCINESEPRGFFNEYLKQEFMEHKRVFEALGSQMKVEASQDQLSGLGFSSTQSNDLIVKVKGQSERLLKIKF